MLHDFENVYVIFCIFSFCLSLSTAYRTQNFVGWTQLLDFKCSYFFLSLCFFLYTWLQSSYSSFFLYFVSKNLRPFLADRLQAMLKRRYRNTATQLCTFLRTNTQARTHSRTHTRMKKIALNLLDSLLQATRMTAAVHCTVSACSWYHISYFSFPFHIWKFRLLKI